MDREASAPQYPLKTARRIYGDAEIAQARANIGRYPAARAVADGITRAADPWLAWSDEDLRVLVTPAEVPRAFDVGSSVGCPKCGQEIHQKFGSYPWLVDLRKPFKLTCPVDGSVYPTNDYETYYKSGFTEKRGWDTAYVDDGWGWENPENGQRYWFVAHYNHRAWHHHLGPGVRALGRAYLLTGDKRYAHKAAVLLQRIAEVYPAMDHEKQSRYGRMQAARGHRYPGKVLNHIWETNLVEGFAEAYDAVWETIDADADLQRLCGKTGKEIRAFIEANLLEEAIAAYFAEKIRGNFGMHQSALAHLALARQHGDNAAWFDGLMNRSGGFFLHAGLNFALYNLVFRDGVPLETGPSYNFIWVSSLSDIAPLMKKADHDLFALPRMRRLYDGVLDVINIGRFTPSVGDSGSVYGGLIGQNAPVFQTAYRHYGDPRYARFLAGFGATGEKGFTTFESLFYPPIPATTETLGPQPARLLDGYGMAILSNPADTVSVSLYYGLRGGHGHFDRMNIELFAQNQPLLPDLGYPDAMNDYVAGIYTWSKNTISHNTVTVDAARQRGNAPGTVRLFADSPFARVVDVDAPGTYPQCSTYRRRLIMVDAGKDRSYFVDLFAVTGGGQHDYSLHGPPGTFEVVGGSWSDPAPGTFAGEAVALGEIYDDPVLGAGDYKGGYNGYAGSGFQHLFNVRRHQGGEWIAQWAHEKDPDARVRIRVLPQSGQQVLLADARVSPVKYPQIVKYVIARRQGKDLDSRFVSVIEPYRSDPFLETVQPLVMDGAGHALAVRRAGGETDLIVHGAPGSIKTVERHGLRTDAHTAVVTLDGQGRARRVFFAGGAYLELAGRRYAAPAAPSGRVVAVDPQQGTIRVRLGSPLPAFDPVSLAGRIAHFENNQRRTAHPIAAARREGDDLVLTPRDDLRVGRARLTSVGESELRTNTALPLAPIYRGVYLRGQDSPRFHGVRAVQHEAIHLVQPLPADHGLAEGQDVWLVNVGPGDRMELPQIFHWERQTEKRTERNDGHDDDAR